MRAPTIYNLNLSYLGTHETIVVQLGGSIQSVNTWNYTTDEQGNRTFMTDNPTVQLFFPKDAIVPVIRS